MLSVEMYTERWEYQMVVIENQYLSVMISPQGGTLQSVRSKENNIEYLWQGDRAYWGGRAPNLFPFVGRLYQEQYSYNGKCYPMKCHGFLGKKELIPEQTGPDSCAFILTDSPETLEIYPFRFTLRLEYRLEGRQIHICFRVRNTGENTMYCGFGGHPGFNIPLEEGLCFEDYAVSFPTNCQVNVVDFSQGVLTRGKKPYPLEAGRFLHLDHNLFHHDAVVFADCPREVTLTSSKGKHGVIARFPDMPYVGFWQVRDKDAPYLCIEPWSVCPGREGVIEDIATMADMTAIKAGETAVNCWNIEIF